MTECSKPMSDVRRTFCLLTLFDLGLTFLLWILYTQISGMSPTDAFVNEVAHYNIHTSLFDLVLLAATRFILLILVYGLIRSHNPWGVAVTTTLSSGFLIAKVFLYSFAINAQKNSSVLDYLLLVSSFIIAWAETWFLDFKVLPRETKELLVALKRAASESTPLLYGGALREDLDTGGTNSAYYSPVYGGTPPPERADSKRTESSNEPLSSPLPNSQRTALIQRARANLDVVKEFQSRGNWRLEKQDPKNEISVFSTIDKKYGKIFKVDGIISAPAERVFVDIYQKVSDAPLWNQSVVFSERIDILDEHCDVTYVCLKDQAGGMVSSRDFVDVRCFDILESQLGRKYIIAAVACEHPKKPAVKEFVRGINGPNAWIAEPLAGAGPNTSRFICFSNTNLKGWIPQTIVDQAMAQVLIDLIQHLKKKFETTSTDFQFRA